MLFRYIYSIAFLALPCFAQSSELTEYSFPAQSLSVSLLATAKQNSLLLIYPSDRVENLQAPALKGNFLLPEALDHLLAGSNLQARITDSRVLTIYPKTRSKPQEIVDKPITAIPTQATTGPSRVEEVVRVTGSYLARPQIDTSVPLQVLTQEDQTRLSLTNLGDLVENSTSTCAGQESIGRSGKVRNIGFVFPNIYCLGSQRNLAIVNGRRMVPTTSIDYLTAEPGTQFDLNTLPSLMVKRVDIISVGASTIYGSGAMSGTLNVLLRDDIEGIEFISEYGVSDYQDGEQYRVGFATGTAFSDGKGHFNLGYEYHEQHIIRHDDRPFTASNSFYIPLTSNNTLTLTDDVRYVGSTRFGIPSPRLEVLDLFNLDEIESPNIFMDAQNRPLAFNEQGQLRAFDPGTPYGVTGWAIGGDGERLSERYALRVPFDRHALYSIMRYDLSPQLRIKTELNIADASSSTPPNNFLHTTMSPIGNIWAEPMLIGLDEGFLRAEDIELIAPHLEYSTYRYFYLHKSWRDLSSDNRQKSSAAQLRLSTDSNFWWLNRNVNVNSYLSYGESKTEVTTHNYQCKSLFAPLELVVRCEFESIQDIERAEEEGDNLIFRRYGQIEPHNLDIYRAENKLTTKHQFSNAALTLRSSLFSLHGGELDWAMGYEYQKYEGSTREKKSVDEPTILIPIDDIDNKYDSQEWFAELYMPFVGAGLLPSLNELSVEASYRSTENSRSGYDYSSAIGLRIGFDLPYSSTLLLRSNNTRSYRFPAFYETFQPPRYSTHIAGSIDPCLSENVATASNPQRRAELCAQDVERSQNSERALRTYDSFVYDDTSFSEQATSGPTVFVAGNENLGNERGVAQNLGLTLTLNEKFHLSADLVTIEFKDTIRAESETTVLSQCYDEGILDACERVLRVFDFELTSIETNFQNRGTASTKLVQTNIYSPLPTPTFLHGTLVFNFSGQFLKEFKNGANEISGDYYLPKRRFLTSLDYQTENFKFSLSADYVSGGQYPYFSNFTIEDRNVDALTRLHLNAQVQIVPNLWLSAGIRNALDKQPPAQLDSRDAVGEYYLRTNYLI